LSPHEGELDRSTGSIAALDAVQQLFDYLKDVPETGQQLLRTVVQELHRADTDLRQATAKYRALVEQIPAIVYVDVADETMATTYVSPQIESLLGITPQEYIDDPDL
jgi:PAS domain-containing protein